MSSLNLQRYLAISDPVQEYNEDIAGVIDGAAWVLDGATGVTDKTYTDAPSDAHWYVNQLDDYLRSNICNTSKSLTEHIADGIVEIGERFSGIAAVSDIDAAAEPSATAAIVRWSENSLEYFVLCDSTLIALDRNNVVVHETDRRIGKTEQTVRQKARELKQQGLAVEEARQCVMPSLRKNRRLKNTENNYWVLSFDPKAAEQAISGYHNIGPQSHIYLFTDGFDRLVRTYDVYPDWETAITDIHQSGIEAALNKLREVERDDPNGDEYFRLKQSDDTTIVKLSFKGEN